MKNFFRTFPAFPDESLRERRVIFQQPGPDVPANQSEAIVPGSEKKETQIVDPQAAGNQRLEEGKNVAEEQTVAVQGVKNNVEKLEPNGAPENAQNLDEFLESLPADMRGKIESAVASVKGTGLEGFTYEIVLLMSENKENQKTFETLVPKMANWGMTAQQIVECANMQPEQAANSTDVQLKKNMEKIAALSSEEKALFQFFGKAVAESGIALPDETKVENSKGYTQVQRDEMTAQANAEIKKLELPKKKQSDRELAVAKVMMTHGVSITMNDKGDCIVEAPHSGWDTFVNKAMGAFMYVGGLMTKVQESFTKKETQSESAPPVAQPDVPAETPPAAPNAPEVPAAPSAPEVPVAPAANPEPVPPPVESEPVLNDVQNQFRTELESQAKAMVADADLAVVKRTEGYVMNAEFGVDRGGASGMGIKYDAESKQWLVRGQYGNEWQTTAQFDASAAEKPVIERLQAYNRALAGIQKKIEDMQTRQNG